MAELDISETTTPTTILDTTIDSETTEGINATGETFYDNENFTKFYGIYKNDAKVKSAVNSFATWVTGLGLTEETQLKMDNITGSGEDTFLSVAWNMIVMKKVNGDSYSEAIRNKETADILNLKPLSPENVRVVFKSGVIIRYEERNRLNKVNLKIPIERMWHSSNDRVADNTHGTSVLEAVEWNVEARKEAKETHRKMLKRNGVVRIIEIDTENKVKIADFKKQWKEALEKGEIILLPKGVAEAKDWHGNLDTAGVLAWLNYLDDELLQLLGIPKIIVGVSGDIEGDSKISYLTFEQVYMRAVTDLEADFWNQLGVRIKFKRPASIKNEVASNEQANTSQTGFQPNDTTAGVGA